MDLPISQFLNFNRPPNGGYGQQQASLEEFPSLSKMSLVSQMQASSRANYVNIAKDNQSTTSDTVQSEFTIKDWDFPALPGSQNNPNVSIIGTKVGGGSGGSATGNKSSPSSTPLNNQTTTSGSSSASSSNGGANNAPQSTANGGAANAHDIGTTAAIDQCGNRDKPFFSPIVSQKSMWLNGAIDRSSILGSSPASTSFLDQRKLEEQQQATLSFLEQQQQQQQQHQQQQQQQQLQQQQQRLQQQQQQQQQQKQVTDDISINGGSCGSNLTNSTGGGGGLSNKGSAEQFGMFGLLCFLNFAEKSPNLASVTFGTDLTALGLNLTATEKLYPSFAGPWSDRTLNVHEIDYPVPPEYLISGSIRDKLQIQLKRYHEDTIFFLFYLYPNDLLQLAAADELYSRDWRYHKEQRAWLTRMPGSRVEKTETHERGTYFIFDHIQWKRISKELTIDYNKLEGQPSI